MTTSAISPISVPQAGVAQMIQDAYNMCEPYQWAREGLVNSLEAGASWVFFGVDRQGLENSGVARRYIADNGHGMTPEQLELFLGMFGGGGKEVGIDANRGVGLKASSYEWNSYGLVVMSWTEEAPDGAMVWIQRSADGQWGQRFFDIEDEDGNVIDTTTIVQPGPDDELGIDLAQFHSEEIKRAGHGVVVLFCGDGPTRDTANGDYLRGENTVRGIAKYLNSRFLEIPKGVQVQVQAVEAGERDESKRIRDDVMKRPDDSIFTLHSRTVTGLRDFVPSPDKMKGSKPKYPDAHAGLVTFPYRGRDIEVEWFYHPKVDGKPVVDGDTSYGPGPCVSYRYDQHTHFAHLSEAYVQRTGYHSYRPYGMHDGAGEIWLLVHAPEFDSDNPTKWGTVPQQSRAMLTGPVGMPTFDDMVKDFGDLFWNEADDLKKILRRKASGSESGTDEDREKVLARAMSRLADRMRPMRWFKARDPKTATETGPEGGPIGAGRNRRGTKPVPDPEKKKPVRKKPVRTGRGSSVVTPTVDVTKDGETPAEERRVSLGLPNVRWEHEPFIEAGYPHLAVMFNDHDALSSVPDAGVVLLNPDFPMFETEIKYWQERFPKAAPEAVAALVREVYETEAVSKVTHLTQMKLQKFEKDGKPLSLGHTPEFRHMMEPPALTAAIVGLVNVEQQVTTRAGGRYGRASTKS